MAVGEMDWTPLFGRELKLSTGVNGLQALK